MKRLMAPRFVRIVNPLPDERGTLILLRSDHENDEYRIGLRNGSIRSYSREEIVDVHFRETARRLFRSAISQICRPIVFGTVFLVWTAAICRGYGWRAAVLSSLASGSRCPVGSR